MRVDATSDDDFETLDDAGHDFVFEPRVEVFGVLAHDDEIDARVP